MAAGEDFGWRSEGLIALLLTPSQVTRALLWVIGIGLSWVAWRLLDASLLAYISGLALPLCMVIASAVWALRDKADSTLDGDHLDASTYERARRLAADVRARSLRYAALAAFCGVLAAGPSISLQLTKVVWEWSVYVAGLGVGQAIYCYLLAANWDDQLRAWKERDIILLRKQQAKNALLERASQSRVVITNTAAKINKIDGQQVRPI